MEDVDKELNDLVTEFAKKNCNKENENDKKVQNRRDKWLQTLESIYIDSLNALEDLAEDEADWIKAIDPLDAVLRNKLKKWRKEKWKNLKRKEHPEHHSEERKQRWAKLNKLLVKTSTDKSTDRSIEQTTIFSKLTWSLVKPLYANCIQKYSQKETHIPKEQIGELQKFYGRALDCMNDLDNDSELRVNILIAQIFIHVCSLYKDVIIYTEEKLDGIQVKSNGQFEFVIKKNNKRVFVIEAKKAEINQGMAQDLVGCEVAAEVDDLDVVYGIVTTFEKWIFFKSLNNVVQKDVVQLEIDANKVSFNSLQKVTGKINAILLEDEENK